MLDILIDLVPRVAAVSKIKRSFLIVRSKSLAGPGTGTFGFAGAAGAPGAAGAAGAAGTWGRASAPAARAAIVIVLKKYMFGECVSQRIFEREINASGIIKLAGRRLDLTRTRTESYTWERLENE